MCITFFVWQHPSLPQLQLLALFNRDELLHRPTAASHFWEDRPGILGGRDLVAGGTWLCVSTGGRAAFLTNFREVPSAQPQGAPSRGALPVHFVTAEDAEAFLAGLDGSAFPGFHLVGADLQAGRLLHLCNRGGGGRGQPQDIPPGLHGVSNGPIEAHWPKVDEGLRRLQQLIHAGAFHAANRSVAGAAAGEPTVRMSDTVASRLPSGGDSGNAASGSSSTSDGSTGSVDSGGGGRVPWDQLFELLSDDRHLERNPERLPQTGYGEDFERRNSGIFVHPVDTPWGPFGTRSKIVLAVWRDGRAELREQYFTEHGEWQEVRHSLEMHTGLPGGGSAGGSGGEDGGSGSSGCATNGGRTGVGAAGSRGAEEG